MVIDDFSRRLCIGAMIQYVLTKQWMSLVSNTAAIKCYRAVPSDGDFVNVRSRFFIPCFQGKWKAKEFAREREIPDTREYATTTVPGTLKDRHLVVVDGRKVAHVIS